MVASKAGCAVEIVIKALYTYRSYGDHVEFAIWVPWLQTQPEISQLHLHWDFCGVFERSRCRSQQWLMEASGQ